MKMNNTERKDNNITFRINTSLKEKFYEICKNKKDVPSDVLTEMIIEYINKKTASK